MVTLHKDPICGMEVDESKAKRMLVHGGKKYYFCSKHCFDAFLRHKGGQSEAHGSKKPHPLHHAQSSKQENPVKYEHQEHKGKQTHIYHPTGKSNMHHSSEKKTGAKEIITIHGMHCASCVSKVEKALKEVEGVKDVSINLATGKAAIGYDGLAPNPDDVKEAVRKAIKQRESRRLDCACQEWTIPTAYR